MFGLCGLYCLTAMHSQSRASLLYPFATAVVCADEGACGAGPARHRGGWGAAGALPHHVGAGAEGRARVLLRWGLVLKFVVARQCCHVQAAGLPAARPVAVSPAATSAPGRSLQTSTPSRPCWPCTGGTTRPTARAGSRVCGLLRLSSCPAAQCDGQLVPVHRGSHHSSRPSCSPRLASSSAAEACTVLIANVLQTQTGRE